jgi:hypothetical protein
VWRKPLVLALVALTVLASTAPAMAEGPDWRPQRYHRYRQAFALAGTITVRVCRGNRPASPYIGQELEIQVGRSHFWQWTPDGRVQIGFDAVEVRYAAVVRGMVMDDAFIARAVVVDVLFECSTS